ncbi:hypothetical protein RRG08_063512 [Elysia crispata]|uniref:Uncharacterized protein n=1 Tax=Elysia crispata TaxID=231223 RepID=A0AAE1B2K9_9GAST|nr:hypothetical protein RRG08_063512 [Elysia crispata]
MWDKNNVEKVQKEKDEMWLFERSHRDVTRASERFTHPSDLERFTHPSDLRTSMPDLPYYWVINISDTRNGSPARKRLLRHALVVNT